MKYFYLTLIFFFCIANSLQAQQIVKDVNAAVTNYKAGNITNMTVAGSKTYFVANDASSGDEPWVTDGTAAGTHILRDINPGKTSSGANDFTYSNGHVFFKANDGTHGAELWRTDGTAAGTVMVKDINTSFNTLGLPNSSGPDKLCDVNGMLFFAASSNPSATDYAIWKTDGTEAGTVQVNNLNTIGLFGGAGPIELINFNGLLYFTEIVTNSNNNLYRISNIGATELVLAGVNAFKLTVTGSNLFFSGNGIANANGAELWKTDGSTTEMIKDIYTGTQNSTPDLLTNVNGALFFTASDGVNGTELWKSDGTEAGTVMVKDITAADNSSTNKPAFLTNVNGTLFFRGYTVAANQELWKSDGTEAGTVLVKDIIPGSSFPGGNPVEFIDCNGTLFFVAGGKELWKSDGTEAGTVLIKKFSFCQSVKTVTAMPDNVVFYGQDLLTNNFELWVSNGNTAGTNLLKNIAVDNPSSLYNTSIVAERFAHANGQFFFSAKNTSAANHSLYSSYGTPVTTVKLDGAAGFSFQFPSDAVNAGGYIYFGYSNAAIGTGLWKSDGTAAGTVIVKDVYPDNLYNANGIIYFSANNGGTGNELWKTDGTAAGTVLVKDINPGSASSNPSNFINLNGMLYFTADNGTNGSELWKSDGTVAGTVMVKDIQAGIQPSFPGDFVTMNGMLYFDASTSTNGNELWKSDGTAAGTILVKDITPNTTSGNPHFLTVVGNKLFFVGDDAGFGNNDELWQSDGTTPGTFKIKEINAGNNPSTPRNLINFNGVLYFSAFEPTTGYELWKSDGTAAGTVLVKDIEPGVQSGMQYGGLSGTPTNVPFHDITKANGFLYFPAATADNGRELWKSDGTDAGTVMVGDLFPGPQSSDPEQITNANGDIYFVAENGTRGKEVFSFKPYDFFVLPPITVQDSMDINWQNISLLNGTNQIIASIKQSGINPLNGLVKTKLTVGASAINYNGRTLARKHADIEPVNDAVTATATVTLYFSQADFTQYNSDDNINSDLPVNPTDIIGKDALRIIQYHGVGTAPGNYPGGEEIINPADDSIVWNATTNYWEVSFTVTGFSGFYLSSAAAGTLPVRILSFSGTLHNDKTILLQWKVAEQSGITSYEIERSATGNNFTTIGAVNANTLNTFTYHFRDASALTENVFYRIKINDQNGRITYSDIINVTIKANHTVSLYPVPAVNYIIIQTKDPLLLNSIATIIDSQGRVLQQQQLNTANQRVDISNWAAGVYYVKLTDGTMLKFQK